MARFESKKKIRRRGDEEAATNLDESIVNVKHTRNTLKESARMVPNACDMGHQQKRIDSKAKKNLARKRKNRL